MSNGNGTGVGGNDGVAASSGQEQKLEANRAKLAALVACLWAGVGVGAMLCGHTAEATRHYAEHARDAIKGCYECHYEEVMEFRDAFRGFNFMAEK